MEVYNDFDWLYTPCMVGIWEMYLQNMAELNVFARANPAPTVQHKTKLTINISNLAEAPRMDQPIRDGVHKIYGVLFLIVPPYYKFVGAVSA